jgi:hypothetical protein
VAGKTWLFTPTTRLYLKEELRASAQLPSGKLGLKMDNDKENQDDQNKLVFNRRFVECCNEIDRFTKEGDNYMKQFASLYVKRIEELSLVLKGKIFAKWGKFGITAKVSIRHLDRRYKSSVPLITNLDFFNIKARMLI